MVNLTGYFTEDMLNDARQLIVCLPRLRRTDTVKHKRIPLCKYVCKLWCVFRRALKTQTIANVLENIYVCVKWRHVATMIIQSCLHRCKTVLFNLHSNKSNVLRNSRLYYANSTVLIIIVSPQCGTALLSSELVLAWRNIHVVLDGLLIIIRFTMEYTVQSAFCENVI